MFITFIIIITIIVLNDVLQLHHLKKRLLTLQIPMPEQNRQIIPK